MPKHRTLELSQEQRQELSWHRDHAQKPSMRERAAALLKIADGQKAAQVAREGLLRHHEPGTLYQWLKRYLQEGIAGWLMRKGRGRKPAFSPSVSRSRASQRSAGACRA